MLREGDERGLNLTRWASIIYWTDANVLANK